MSTLYGANDDFVFNSTYVACSKHWLQRHTVVRVTAC